MVMSIRIDAKNVINMLSGYERTLPTGARRGLWLATLDMQKEIRNEIKAKKLIWRGKLLKETRARKISKNSYGIFMPAYGEKLDSMSDHFVALKRGRLLTQWVQTSKKSPWKGKPFSQLPGAIKVHPHPFIMRPFLRSRKRTKRIVTKEIDKAIRRGGRK